MAQGGISAIEIATARPGDGPRWNVFVTGLEAASYCHAFEWYEVIRRVYGKRCYYLYASADGRWLGVLPLVRLKGPLTGNRLVSLPYLDQGGIVASSPQAAEALRREALDLARRTRASGLDFRGPSGLVPRAATGIRRFRFLLPLGETEEDLWNRIGPKVRNQVRKAKNSGVETRRVPSGRLDDFYAIFARNMRDLGSPVHSKRFFRGILSAFGPQASLYLASDAAELPVAAAVAIRFGDTVVVPWASSLRRARSTCPNHSLYWKVLRDAQRDSALRFDFGRSSLGTGTYQFKKQWKAEPVALRWESCDARGRPEPEASLDPHQHTRLVAAWQRIPVKVANLLGPWVRRQLAN